MVEVTVARLGIDSSTNSHVVILRERHGARLLPIWIGRPEAESIVMQMNEVKRERPLTHDLCKALVVALGGSLRRVTISRVKKNTYFAEMHLESESGVVQLDARPSDSIAIALRMDAPIFVDESLMSDPDDDDDDRSPDTPDADAPDAGLFGRSRQADMDTQALQDYLAQLRPEDFGKFRP